MAWLDRLRNVFRPAGLARDLEREIEFHLAERVDELMAGAAGALPAWRAARLDPMRTLREE